MEGGRGSEAVKGKGRGLVVVRGREEDEPQPIAGFHLEGRIDHRGPGFYPAIFCARNTGCPSLYRSAKVVNKS